MPDSGCAYCISVYADDILLYLAETCEIYTCSTYKPWFHVEIRATLRITANVLNTKVDAQCDKLATEQSWQRLIHPTVRPQYSTNVRDRQTERQTGQERQRSDSIGRTVGACNYCHATKVGHAITWFITDSGSLVQPSTERYQQSPTATVRVTYSLRDLVCRS